MATNNKSVYTTNTSQNANTNIVPFLNLKGFQRLYLEYYAFIKDLEVEQITSLYHQGLKTNLENSNFNSEILRYVKKDIDQQAKHIKENTNQYRDALHKNITPEAMDLKEALSNHLHTHHQSYYQNSDRKDEHSDQTKSLNELEKKFLDQLESNPDDLLSHFNLAWVYFHLFEDHYAAQVQFRYVVDHSITDDNPLTQIAMRYLSLNYFFLGDTVSATSTLQRAASLDQSNDLHYLYEMAQQTIHENNNDSSISRMKALIKRSTLYYIHIQSDPFFAGIEKVDKLLARFHSAKLEAIKETTYSKWKKSKLMQQTLPEEFDPQDVFNSTYGEHLTLLTHQPYPLLCKTEMISEKLFTKLQRKTHLTLGNMNNEFMQRIQSEQKKWKFVNLTGVGLVYFAVLLTLASIFLFIGGDLLGLTANNGAIDWGHLVPRIFASVLGMGVIGIGLLQYNPPTLKRLAKKKNMLVEAME